MSTNFPSSVDTYTNPAPTDTLDSVSVPHAGQHDNLNDAMTAVQTYALANGLLTGSGVPAGGTGVNTNLYLDTVSGIIYRKTAGTWAAVYTPAGGLRRGVLPVFITGQTASGGASAFKGFLFTPTANLSITAMYLNGTAGSSAQTYQGKILTLASNSPGSTTVSTVVGSSDAVAIGSVAYTTLGGAGGQLALPCSTPIALVAGTTYAVMAGCTTGGGTFVLPICPQLASGASDPSTGLPGSMGASVSIAVAPPIVSSAATVTTVTNTGGRLLVGLVGDF